jgi:hypothetical protein
VDGGRTTLTGPKKERSALLNANQEQSLGTTLGLVEEDLKRLQQILLLGKDRGLFSHIIDDLTPEEKLSIQGKFDRLMDCLAELKKFFDFPTIKKLRLRWEIQAISLHLSVLLGDVMSPKLSGYGEVDPGLREALDPKLEKMISILRRIDADL